MSKVILLVEDNASDEKLTVLAFKKCGVANEVVVMRDGAAALEYLFGLGPNAPLPAVILLDLKLPKVDGLEVLRRIRSNESTKLLPVIILSASREREDVNNSCPRRECVRPQAGRILRVRGSNEGARTAVPSFFDFLLSCA